MNIKRMLAIFYARNREFFRDRAAFGWNFVFPFLIILGFAVVFGGSEYRGFKVGVFPCPEGKLEAGVIELPEKFRQTRYLSFVGFGDLETGLDKLRHHKVDILVEKGSGTNRYWISDDSPGGYVVEKLFKASLMPETVGELAEKRAVEGTGIRYIDWLFPGILAMNMMFSALYGVGYVIVRYRRNGVLKRLKATPVTALEFLSAHMLSRIFLLMFTVAVVWTGCDLLFSFKVEGSYLDLALIFLAGSLALSSMGLLLAARGTSEEVVNGVLNFISWPMMFLSEVWFSIEGAPVWVKRFAEIFPLTHVLSAVRKVMNDGLALMDVTRELWILGLMTLVCLVAASLLFSWNR